jgi:hypothetical protein
MVLLLFVLFRAGFEPLSWRGDHGLSSGIEARFGFIGRYHITRHGSKPARIGVAKEPNHGRAEFFALPPRRFTYSPAATNSPAGGASIWNCSGLGLGPLTWVLPQ